LHERVVAAGEATVKQVQESLMARPARNTIDHDNLDRLAQKGIVSRRKVGRAYLYRAACRLRGAASAVSIVTGFFFGDHANAAAHLQEVQRLCRRSRVGAK